jgi:hypothetical protein
MKKPKKTDACDQTPPAKPVSVPMIDLVIAGEHNLAPADSAEPFRKLPPPPPGDSSPLPFDPANRPPGFSKEQIEVLEAKGFFPSGGKYVRMTKTSENTLWFEDIEFPPQLIPCVVPAEKGPLDHSSSV